MASGHNLFESKKEFKFSTELKHSGISVTSDMQIKSTEGYSYRFALMEPALQTGGGKAVKVAFKVKENQSNWLAVGVCYKNTVASSDYTFNYSTLGHGAYLVSSNAGTPTIIQVHGLQSMPARTIKCQPSTITSTILSQSSTILSSLR
jgi:hypothetical protein